MADTVVGIDLGTTLSLCAWVGPRGPEVVRDEAGRRFVPSVLSFTADGEVLIGDEARRRAIAEPENTIFSIKRLMGKGLADLEHELRFVPYHVEETDRKLVRVRVRDRAYTPQELSAMILREVRDRAEARLGVEVTRAVITVPAYFDDAQRQATRDAGRLAGLDVLRIINEPTAAAIAYGLDRQHDGLVVVYDFGGGTLDVSILKLRDGVFQVLSTSGDTYLGGDDIDRSIMDVAAREIATRHGVDVRRDPSLLQALRDAAEATKIELSDASSAELGLRSSDGSLDYRRPITREELETLLVPLVERSLRACRQALTDAKLETTQVNDVVLVGGTTRIPYVRRRVKEFFGRDPHVDLDPEEVVALGAAVQAHALSGDASGSAMQEILLLDVTPLSLGIDTMGGAFSKLIMRNSTIPARATDEFTTWVDGQTNVDIHILQGERELSKDNRSLGRFTLRGIPPMPAGIPRIEVTFLIDQNGILKVQALEKRSGREASVEVVPSHGLTNEEVERMLLESVEKAEEDMTARRMIDLRTDGEVVIRATEKSLANVRARLSPAQQAEVRDSIVALRGALAGSDPSAAQAALDRLNLLTMPIAEMQMNAVAEHVLRGKKLSEIGRGGEEK
ncbi:MAG: Fe-S protein assembly chaperone HscA [Planctomycetes bacterium]|nr:Fe-S protein assembly chaperone HscA [Planctomycetota bacterium]MBI3846266.1 Fe-S protein assembly chaperone HscA [Planctomycetota bacterium]